LTLKQLNTLKTKHKTPYFFMFGLHSKLATEAFLRLPENIEKPKDQSEYVRKLEDR